MDCPKKRGQILLENPRAVSAIIRVTGKHEEHT